jgi:ribokinase
MKKDGILVVGSSNTDMIITLDRLPKPGETLMGRRFVTAAGGKGANQAVGAARAGGRVTLVARLGRDMFGDQALAGFIKDGINTDFIQRDRDLPSGAALIFVAKAGENCIAVASGANGKLCPADVRRARPAFAHAAVLLTQLETPLPTVQAAVDLAAACGMRVILNPAPARPLPDRLLRRVFLITPNETEAGLLTGIRVDGAAAAARAADKLLARGVQAVIITLGAKGAFAAYQGRRQLVPGFKMKAVDTTAAGDVFNGALAVALAEGQPMAQAIRFANAAAAISVTRLGAQPSAPKRGEIMRLLAKGGNNEDR